MPKTIAKTKCPFHVDCDNSLVITEDFIHCYACGRSWLSEKKGCEVLDELVDKALKKLRDYIN